MVYELAQWLFKKAQEYWRAIWRKGFFGKIFSFPFFATLSIIFLVVSFIFYAASFMTILEKLGKSFFFFCKRKMEYSGLFGKICYLPLFLLAVAFCLGVIILSVGQAGPFKQS